MCASQSTPPCVFGCAHTHEPSRGGAIRPACVFTSSPASLPLHFLSTHHFHSLLCLSRPFISVIPPHVCWLTAVQRANWLTAGDLANKEKEAQQIWIPAAASTVGAGCFGVRACAGVCMLLTHCTCRDNDQREVRGKERRDEQTKSA